MPGSPQPDADAYRLEQLLPLGHHFVCANLMTQFCPVGKHVQIRFDMPDGRLVDDGFWLRGRCGSEFGHSHVRY